MNQVCVNLLLLFAFCVASEPKDGPAFEWDGEGDESVDSLHEKTKYRAELNNPSGPGGGQTKKWAHYLEAIERAREEYTPCLCDSNLAANCCCFLSQIESDLKPWGETGITREMLELSRSFGVFYQIINHTVYRQKECHFPGRCEGIEHFLLKNIDDLPDLEMVVNVRDWSQVMTDKRRNHVQGIPLPVFSFSKNTQWYHDILYPAWSFWAGGPAIDQYPTGIGKWGHLRETIVKSSPSWEKKKPIAFFRGSRTSPERDPLILLSRSRPDLVDAQYTKNQAWRSNKDTLGTEPAPTIPFEKQCLFKYLFNLRGVAASFRYKHLFMCKSLVLNVESDWIEYFYPQLKAWVHYVPVANDLKDIQEKVEFVRENDHLAKEMAEEGFSFVWDHITMDSVDCYWKQLLKSYQKLLRYTPLLSHDVVEIRKGRGS